MRMLKRMMLRRPEGDIAEAARVHDAAVAGSGVFRISKRGGGKFLLATSAHTKGGAKPSFPIFLVCQKKFLAKGGHGLMARPKYASGSWDFAEGNIAEVDVAESGDAAGLDVV